MNQIEKQNYISKNTIVTIALLSPDKLESHGIIQKAKHGGYICYLCGNGTGKDGTGITPKTYSDHVGWKCQKCGEKFNNMKIFAAHYGLDVNADFPALVEKICAEFNIALQYDSAPTEYQKITRPENQTPPAELNLINADLATGVEPLKAFVAAQDGLWRGLPLEVLEKYGCRFIDAWTPPTARAANKFSTPTPRLIIPANADSLHSNYLARLTCGIDSFDASAQAYIKEKQHAGVKTLFNPDALCAETVFALEGYIDAMSLELAGFNAVAVGGATSYQLLVDAVKPLEKKPRVIILFDGDESGRLNADKLQAALFKIGVSAVVKFIDGENSKTDANEILTTNGVDDLRGRLEKILAESQTEFIAIEKKLSAQSNSFVEIPHDYQPLPEPADRNQNSEEKKRTVDFISNCPADLILPDKFTFGKRGIQYVEIREKKNGDIVKKFFTVATTPIVVTKIFREPNKNSVAYEVAILDGGKWRYAEVDGRTLIDSRSLAILGNYGALIVNARMLVEYFAKLISKNEIPEVVTYKKPGWQDEDSLFFAYPTGGTTPDGSPYIVRRAGIDYPTLFKAKGDPEKWKKVFQELIIPAPLVAVKHGVVGASLAAPLLKIIGVKNFSVHLAGRSGFAKSPFLKFGLSVYGNPAEGYLTRTFDSSPKNRVAMAVAFNDLPQGLDELESLPKKAADDLPKSAYDYFAGVDGQKNKRDGTTREAEYFRGIRISTGERPYVQQTDKRGAFKRVLPIRIDRPLLTDEQARNLHIFLDNNYGHFGREWTEYIAKHAREIQSDFDSLFNQLATDGFKRNGDRAELNELEPTHARDVCACIVAFYHFRVCIGLAKSFADDLREAFYDVGALCVILPTQDEISDTGRALEALASYVLERPRNFENENAPVTFPDDVKGERSPGQLAMMPPVLREGRIFKNGDVAFLTNAFRRIVEKELNLPSAEKIIAELFDENRLAVDSGRKTKRVRIDDTRAYAYVVTELLKSDTETSCNAEDWEICSDD